MLVQYKLPECYIRIAGIMLLVTGVLKVISTIGAAGIWMFPDPVFKIPYRELFWVIGIVELGISSVCLFGSRLEVQAGLLAWLASNFVGYRLALHWMKSPRPCPCLGGFTDMLHISVQKADLATKAVLVYMVIGSYALLLMLWIERRATNFTTTADGV
jgi:hypothetical protein